MLADLARIDSPVARHPQVKHQSVAPVGVDQPVFGAAAKPDDPRAGQPLAKVDRKRPPQIRPARLDPFDPAAIKHVGQAADGCFNFGKLGHRARYGGGRATPLEARGSW